MPENLQAQKRPRIQKEESVALSIFSTYRPTQDSGSLLLPPPLTQFSIQLCPMHTNIHSLGLYAANRTDFTVKKMQQRDHYSSQNNLDTTYYLSYIVSNPLSRLPLTLATWLSHVQLTHSSSIPISWVCSLTVTALRS